jgi:predicted  nucleic acid-binding Zn-ribbon protein
MEFICAKCSTELEKSAALLRTGCPMCGSRVFTTNLSSQIEEQLQPEIEATVQQDPSKYKIIPEIEGSKILEESDNIPSIKLREKGVYEVNIGGLFRDKKLDPVILSGKPGIYRVELLKGTNDDS